MSGKKAQVIIVFFGIILFFRVPLTSSVPNGYVILQFDDSLETTYTLAFPMMQAHGFHGVCAVITGCVDDYWYDGEYRDKKCMTLKQLKELQSAGWQIESHSATHRRFKLLTREEALWEFTESLSWLRRNGFSPKHFMYPYGLVKYLEDALEWYDSYIPNNDYTFITKNHVEAVFTQTDKAIVFVIHDILEEPVDPWEMSIEEFGRLLAAISENRMGVIQY